MGYYLISCGGTGAKCTEAFVHLLASGLMPDKESVKVFFMDADLANGQNKSTQRTIDAYQKAHNSLQQSGSPGDTAFFKNTLEFNPEHIWDPLPSQNQTLDSILNMHTLSSKAPDICRLYELLYPESKRQATFQNGFLGWPSVGSAIISSHTDRMQGFLQNISADTQAKVLLVGSVFGGTGAASAPTLARIIRNLFDAAAGQGQRQLGLCLMLPYFVFNNQQGDDNEDVDSSGDIINPNIDPANFLLKTQMALNYYYHHKVHEDCDRIYLLGDSVKNLVSNRVAIGGGAQQNKPHYMELFAGLAMIDFFGANLAGKPQNADEVYQELSRQQRNLITWTDLPHSAGWQQVYEHFWKLHSAGFAYNCRFAPLLEQLRLGQIDNKDHQAWMHRMIINQFDLANGTQHLNHLREYFKELFKWQARLHQQLPNNPEKMDLQLFNRQLLHDYLAKDTTDHIVPNPAQFNALSHAYHYDFGPRPAGMPGAPKPGFMNPQEGFDKVNHQLNGIKQPAPGTRGLGSLFHALQHFAI